MTDRPGLFDLDGSAPRQVMVHRTGDPTWATPLYSPVLDYGWASRVLGGGHYVQDANAIARCISRTLKIPCRVVAPEEHARNLESCRGRNPV